MQHHTKDSQEFLQTSTTCHFRFPMALVELRRSLTFLAVIATLQAGVVGQQCATTLSKVRVSSFSTTIVQGVRNTTLIILSM